MHHMISAILYSDFFLLQEEMVCLAECSMKTQTFCFLVLHVMFCVCLLESVMVFSDFGVLPYFTLVVSSIVKNSFLEFPIK